MAAPPIGIGDVLAGKYVIERAIGEGGMGVVYAARHRELEQRVAIKFLLSDFAEQGMAAERFRREARAAARMRGEHICRVLDVGTLDTGVPFMVMEYLEGRDLASELDRRGQLPVEESVGYLLEACEALAEAHVAGIIHRDLKPANLFLETRADGSRRIKVLDFGVSKLLLSMSEGNGALTKTSSLVGSPLYMSPEQLDSARDVDARTDVWALGVVLFELLTGNTPFRGDTIPQLVAAVLQEAPVRMPTLAVPLPPGLSEVVCRALAKQRDQRYSSVAELAQALSPYAPPSARESILRIGRLLGARPSAEASEPSTRVATAGAVTPLRGSENRTATPASWDRPASISGRKLVWAIAAFVVLVAATARFVAWRAGSARPSGTPSADAQAAVPGSETAPAAQVASPEAPARGAEPAREQAALPAPGAVVDATAPTGVPVAPKEAAPPGPSVPPTAAPVRARADVKPERPREPGSVASPEPTPIAVPKPAPGGSQRDLSDFGGRR